MLLNYGADIERKGMNAYRPLVRCGLARFSREYNLTSDRMARHRAALGSVCRPEGSL